MSVSFALRSQPTQSSQRQTKYVNTGGNLIQWTATTASPTVPQGVTVTNANMPLSTCSVTVPNTGVGPTEQCNFGMLPGTYTIQLNFQYCTPAQLSAVPLFGATGCTQIGNSTTSSQFVLAAPGSVAQTAVQLYPFTGLGSGSGPALSLDAGSPTMLFQDSTINVIAVYANELDPIGNIITSYYGPVCVAGSAPCTAGAGLNNYGWPLLYLADSGGTAGVGVNGTSAATFNAGGTPPGFSIGGPPGGQNGNIELIEYDGVSSNTSNLTLTLNDGFGNPAATSGAGNTLSFPFVKMTSTQPGTTSGSPLNLGTTGTQTMITFTETTTGTMVPDAPNATPPGLGFVSYTTCGSQIQAFSPVNGLNSIPAASGSPLSSSLTYTLTAGTGAGSCQFVVQSQADPNLDVVIWVKS